MLENTPYQPSKFRAKNWDEINDDSRRTYNTNSQTRFKTPMSESGLSNYGNVYILVSGTFTVVGAGADNAARVTDRNDKQAML